MGNRNSSVTEKMKSYYRLVSIILLYFSFIPTYSLASDNNQGDEITRNHKLKIAVYDSPPFGMKDNSGAITGLSVECWEKVAENLNLTYEYFLTDMDDLLEGVQTNRYDLAIGAITITPHREEIVDFTHPVNQSGTGIAVSTRSDKHPFWSLWKLVFINLAELLVGLIFLITIFGLLVWMAERKINQSEYHRKIKGLGDGLWWAAVTMTTVGYGDKAPRTTIGRLLAIIWMFTSIILVSLFTASTSSILTSGKIESTIQKSDQLRDVRVGAAVHSSGEEYLIRHNIFYFSYTCIEDALDALVNGEIDAVVSNVPVIKYLKQKTYKKKIRIIPNLLAENYMGMAIQQSSPYFEPINHEILVVTSDKYWNNTIAKYLGEDL